MIPIGLALAMFAAAGSPTSLLPQTGASRIALATVTDARNRPIVDLGPDDFVIQEGGRSREILSVRPGDYPIVVLLDNGAEAQSDFPQIQKAVAHFIDRVGQRPIVIGTLGNVPRLVSAFDDDRTVMMKKLGELSSETAGASLILQAAALGGRALKETGALFSAIVVLSATSHDTSQSTLEEMTGPVVDSGAMLHVIANRAGQPPPQHAALGTALRSLAEQTRGEFTTIYSATSYQVALDRLADRLTSELMVEYLVPVGSKASDVKVGVRVVGARVRGLGVAPK